MYFAARGFNAGFEPRRPGRNVSHLTSFSRHGQGLQFERCGSCSLKFEPVMRGLVARISIGKEVIAAGEWRQSLQAKAWAGKAVASALGLDAEDKGDRKRIGEMLKRWIKTKALVVVERMCDDRYECSFVEVREVAKPGPSGITITPPPI
jgi:hypothetical protein